MDPQQDQETPDESSGVVVRAVSAYRPDESDLSHHTDKKYVFSYRIEIENQGSTTIQLRSRHWWITDARQDVRELKGDGVVGQYPVIAPGQVFGYFELVRLAHALGLDARHLFHGSLRR